VIERYVLRLGSLRRFRLRNVSSPTEATSFRAARLPLGPGAVGSFVSFTFITAGTICAREFPEPMAMICRRSF
jgi:hypothetical protein